ncbi:MAG: hypothetical protein U9R38_03735 [Candidatus Margulisiibacteriota bacterium]|nr:hypothetical protein [Candidatus Margulisiibacteriota bacterium]
MKVPEFLYHGTAAMSVWASYHHWQALGKLHKKEPQLVEKQLRPLSSRCWSLDGAKGGR